MLMLKYCLKKIYIAKLILQVEKYCLCEKDKEREKEKEKKIGGEVERAGKKKISSVSCVGI